MKSDFFARWNVPSVDISQQSLQMVWNCAGSRRLHFDISKFPFAKMAGTEAVHDVGSPHHLSLEVYTREW